MLEAYYIELIANIWPHFCCPFIAIEVPWCVYDGLLTAVCKQSALWHIHTQCITFWRACQQCWRSFVKLSEPVENKASCRVCSQEPSLPHPCNQPRYPTKSVCMACASSFQKYYLWITPDFRNFFILRSGYRTRYSASVYSERRMSLHHVVYNCCLHNGAAAPQRQKYGVWILRTCQYLHSLMMHWSPGLWCISMLHIYSICHH